MKDGPGKLIKNIGKSSLRVKHLLFTPSRKSIIWSAEGQLTINN